MNYWSLVENNGLNALKLKTLNSDDHMLLDMATSAAAVGKMELARTHGTKLPPGWALNKDGQPTTCKVLQTIFNTIYSILIQSIQPQLLRRLFLVVEAVACPWVVARTPVDTKDTASPCLWKYFVASCPGPPGVLMSASGRFRTKLPI